MLLFAKAVGPKWLNSDLGAMGCANWHTQNEQGASVAATGEGFRSGSELHIKGEPWVR
jgi:hypothetical protein